jgi:hypothetical protein
MFLSLLLLLTIVFAFTTGIAAGYGVIMGVLHLFDPARLPQKRTADALAVSID